MILRPARSTDAGKLGAMITQAVAARDWKPLLHTGAEDIAHMGRLIDYGWVMVAEDTRVLGFLARDEDYIHALFVDETAQNQGVGSALLQDAMSKRSKLDLWTFVENTGAQRFYERHGFSETHRTDGSRNEEQLPDIHFQWEAP